MPRPNQPRTIAGESALSRHIAHQRTARGMSYEALAIQMKHVGCPINASALYRIEKGDPPRRITVDELIAFAEVFRVPMEALLLPPEVAARNELVDLLVAWEETRVTAADATEAADAALEAVRQYVQENPEIEDVLHDALGVWAEHYFEDDERPGAVAYRMWHFTKGDKWLDKVREELDA